MPMIAMANVNKGRQAPGSITIGAFLLYFRYDIILDCTDNVATRYLLNDSCVMLHKPLVSGSALRFEGQLTVYNYSDGPCYRCLFPEPPPPNTVNSCSDAGVIGPGLLYTFHMMALQSYCSSC